MEGVAVVVPRIEPRLMSAALSASRAKTETGSYTLEMISTAVSVRAIRGSGTVSTLAALTDKDGRDDPHLQRIRTRREDRPGELPSWPCRFDPGRPLCSHRWPSEQARSCSDGHDLGTVRLDLRYICGAGTTSTGRSWPCNRRRDTEAPVS